MSNIDPILQLRIVRLEGIKIPQTINGKAERFDPRILGDILCRWYDLNFMYSLNTNKDSVLFF